MIVFSVLQKHLLFHNKTLMNIFWISQKTLQNIHLLSFCRETTILQRVDIHEADVTDEI